MFDVMKAWMEDPTGMKALKLAIERVDWATDKRFDAMADMFDKVEMNFALMKAQMKEFESNLTKLEGVDAWLSGVINLLVNRQNNLRREQLLVDGYRPEEVPMEINHKPDEITEPVKAKKKPKKVTKKKAKK